MVLLLAQASSFLATLEDFHRARQGCHCSEQDNHYRHLPVINTIPSKEGWIHRVGTIQAVQDATGCTGCVHDYFVSSGLHKEEIQDIMLPVVAGFIGGTITTDILYTCWPAKTRTTHFFLILPCWCCWSVTSSKSGSLSEDNRLELTRPTDCPYNTMDTVNTAFVSLVPGSVTLVPPLCEGDSIAD